MDPWKSVPRPPDKMSEPPAPEVLLRHEETVRSAATKFVRGDSSVVNQRGDNLSDEELRSLATERYMDFLRKLPERRAMAYRSAVWAAKTHESIAAIRKARSLDEAPAFRPSTSRLSHQERGRVLLANSRAEAAHRERMEADLTGERSGSTLRRTMQLTSSLSPRRGADDTAEDADKLLKQLEAELVMRPLY